MRRILVGLLVLLPALPAFAARTFAVDTLVKKGSLKLKAGETAITARAKLGTKVSKSLAGSTGIYVPLHGTKNVAGDRLLFQVDRGEYFVSPTNQLFTVKK